ncbi:hypothetical protein SAMN06296386_11080 [Lachnospiraceae bacterium]|nr:hypothetical protein SAMN06296386_11080 [Lachnospiraceae bacterium]
MTDHKAVAWFFLNCLKDGVKKFADMDALLASSGLLSRGYMDALLPDDMVIDTWEQEDTAIFPAQCFIYDHIFNSEVYPEELYDIIFFLRNEYKKKSDAIHWAMHHGKKLFFKDAIPYSVCSELEIDKIEIEELLYNGEVFFEIDVQKIIYQKIEELMNREMDTEAMQYMLERPCLLTEDIFLLKAAIGIAAEKREYEMMWKYVSQAYRIAPDDADLELLYKKWNKRI